jgi:hypothetical protein
VIEVGTELLGDLWPGGPVHLDGHGGGESMVSVLRGCRVYSCSAMNDHRLDGQATEESRACAAQTTPSATKGRPSQSTSSRRLFLNEDHVRSPTERPRSTSTVPEWIFLATPPRCDVPRSETRRLS